MYPIIDMHCDTIPFILEEKDKGNEIKLRKNELSIDLERMKAAGYMCQSFSLYTNLDGVKKRERTPFENAMMLSDLLDRELADNKDIIRIALTASDIEKNYEEGFLTDIEEKTKIIKTETGAAFTDNDADYVDINPDTIVSMNMWGFSKSFMSELKEAFKSFMEKDIAGNPLKAECYLPFVVDDLIKSGKATVKVLTSSDKWFGVTYKEDKPFVMESIKALKENGIYPQKLW